MVPSALNSVQEKVQDILRDQWDGGEDEMPLHLQKRPKKRKTRVPWSDEEEKILINLICKDGAKWAKFEQQLSNKAGGLWRRDQGAMKDKARNILRRIIQEGNESKLYAEYPNWREVSVGAARRGVHAYMGTIPDRRKEFERKYGPFDRIEPD